MLLKFMALLTVLVPMVSVQQQETQSVIVTPRTRAVLSCESGDMVVKVDFSQPFRGLLVAHKSPCKVRGVGGLQYTLRIPLKGCGTWQESPRIFANNVTIRFHPALELEEDETKMVVCRYPPPLTPSPRSVVVMEPVPTAANGIPNKIVTASLSEVEILIIICLLLFLSLLTLGIGIAYFCLKRRNIHLVRKGNTSTPPSQITRLSSSHMQPSSLLSSLLEHTIRIPRAVPYSVPAGRSSALSSPDHPYEEYPASTSTASGGSSETSVSSSSEEQLHSTYNLLLRKVGPSTLLSIPKAILRKTTPQPTMHSYLSNTSSPFVENQTSLQTEVDELKKKNIADDEPEKISNRELILKSSKMKTFPPVYARIDKSKKMVTKTQQITENLNDVGPGTKANFRAPSYVLSAAEKSISPTTDVPEESVTSEEIIKDSTVTTTLVRQEITDTSLTERLNPKTDSKTGDIQIIKMSQQPLKKILIRDISDTYLTTTVETESRETRTKVTRDNIPEVSFKEGPNRRADNAQEVNVKKTWNVVIRQKPSTSTRKQSQEIREFSEEEKPVFDVMIRTSSPAAAATETKDKEMATIPQFEIPQAINMLKEALQSKETKDLSIAEQAKEKDIPRTIHWGKDTKEKTSTSSSSDCSCATASLRERSTSEVLEIAPTLPKKVDMLERSTSEIVTAPREHVRWVEFGVPVLESPSGQFLARREDSLTHLQPVHKEIHPISDEGDTA